MWDVQRVAAPEPAPAPPAIVQPNLPAEDRAKDARA
jgi:hypothetical protein